MPTTVSTETDERFYVVCFECGQVLTPAVRSPLWWKTKKYRDEGYVDTPYVTGKECGCVTPIARPEAAYRVVGFTDLCKNFDYPFDSLVQAARMYLELKRGLNTVFFVDTRANALGKVTRVQKRLNELAGRPYLR